MPKITIDDITVEVSPGTNVLDAAKAAGIFIPHFCYHEALGNVGACRLCAVKFMEGPVKGIQMSCMIPAQDGMVVSTTDPEARQLRKLVIEWLMINHPHDCPVCDEGGECLLQDYTVSGEHAIRRFKGKKRTFLNQDLGPYIHHEMNRCIECYRCARFYQEYAGGKDLGTMGSAGRVYFGRFQEGQLESPFSGNLVDICPTGVYTDKTARYRARYWDYQMAPSICPRCSLGCNIYPVARYRELLKIVPRRNDAVNGWFICDRGRFDKGGVNDALRPRQPMVDGRIVGWNELYDLLVLRIQHFIDRHGPEALAFVGSNRLPMEAGILLQQLAKATGSPVCHFTDAAEAAATDAVISLLSPGTAASMEDIRTADLIAFTNCELPGDAPMLGLAARQAWRKGARLFAVEVSAAALETAVSVAVTPAASLDDIPFGEATKPVIICGTGRGNGESIAEVFRHGTRVCCILSGPNSFGSAILARMTEQMDIGEAVASGKVKGIVAIEADVSNIISEKVEFLAAADFVPTDIMKRASIAVPTAAWVETDGTFINNEGRAQQFRRVMKPGLPIKGFEPQVHPPHTPRVLPPGGDIPAPAEFLATVLERLTGKRVEEPFSGPFHYLAELDEKTGMNCLEHLPPKREEGVDDER